MPLEELALVLYTIGDVYDRVFLFLILNWNKEINCSNVLFGFVYSICCRNLVVRCAFYVRFVHHMYVLFESDVRKLLSTLGRSVKRAYSAADLCLVYYMNRTTPLPLYGVLLAIAISCCFDFAHLMRISLSIYTFIRMYVKASTHVRSLFAEKHIATDLEKILEDLDVDLKQYRDKQTQII